MFFNARNAFNKAAEDFYSRQEQDERKRKQQGKISVQRKNKDDDGDYVPYEEIK
jgi:hypothetical protein